MKVEFFILYTFEKWKNYNIIINTTTTTTTNNSNYKNNNPLYYINRSKVYFK